MKRAKRKKKQVEKHGLQIYKRLLRYVFPYWKLFVISLIGFFLYAGTQPLFAAMIKYVIDVLQTDSREGVTNLPLLFVGLMVVRGIGSFLGNYFMERLANNVVHGLRCEIFNHYTCLPTAYFDENNSGYMMSRITHNVGEVTRATAGSVKIVVREGFTAMGLLAYLFYVNWQLSLVFLTVTPVIVLMVSYVSKRLRKLSKRIQDSVGDMTHITSELVGGHRIVRSFGGEEYEKNRFQKASQFNRGQSLKLAMTAAINGPLLQILIASALAGLMYLALNIMAESSAGEFVSYLTAAFLLPRPFRQLSDTNTEIQRGIAAAESLFDVLDEPPEKDEGKYQSSQCTGELEFKNVTFIYPGSKIPALNDVSFKVKSGQTVALVGASGGGKSTLSNLIPRFYEHDIGKILLDGVEINEYTLANLRRQISVVTQHVTLFNDTVASNIAYGVQEDATRKQIIQAAIDAYAMEFIDKLPKGLDAEIGEHGIKLSGGQRQRLALARALLKNSPILILDEATSALDTESERYIQEALKTIMTKRTTLVIAHRLSTIENADIILVLEQGRIIESGGHQELLSKKGVYSKLYQMQFESSAIVNNEHG